MAVNKNNVKIHVSHLKKSFGHLEVIKDISTDIYEGEVVVILGPSGSGKSTFLRCINRLEEPTGGEIIVDGQAITDKKADLNKIRENIGMVFQHFNLFNNLNVIQNLMLAPVQLKKASKEKAKEEAMAMLKKVGLEDKAEAYPHQLSGGQKQRVAIARSLCMNPDIMLFDEPTSALDPEMVGEVLQVMKDRSTFLIAALTTASLSAAFVSAATCAFLIAVFIAEFLDLLRAALVWLTSTLFLADLMFAIVAPPLINALHS